MKNDKKNSQGQKYQQKHFGLLYLRDIFKDKSQEELETVKIIYENNENNFEKTLTECFQIFGESIEDFKDQLEEYYDDDDYYYDGVEEDN